MLVKTLLAEKSGAIACISPEATISEAAAMMTTRRIGALLVIDEDGALAGIIGERDLVRGMAEVGRIVLDKPVSALMTRRVLCVGLEDSVDSLMAKMTERRIRHFPVMDRGRLAGIVSIGDVVKHKIAEAECEAQALRAYIAG
jgi:CBS domain-containing protein